MKSLKRLYIAAKILNIVALIHAILLFLCNLLGSWVGYHLMGFGWAFWQYPAAVFMVISMLRALFGRGKDYSFGQRLKDIFLNLWLLLVSMLINHLAINYFSPWGLYEHLYQVVESLMKMLG